jgi:propanol-preferring alcohol dehydrogenase
VTDALRAAATRSVGDLTLVGVASGTLPFGFFSPGYEVSVAST